MKTQIVMESALFFLLVVLPTWSKAEVNREKYRKVTLEGELISQSMLISSVVVASLTECCASCSYNEKCGVVQYETSKRVCYQLSLPYLKLSHSSTTKRTYHVKGYGMFQYVDIERQWAVAQESCAGNGGRLLQVDTDEKWNYWKSIEHPFTDAITYWIGLNDIESEGNFVWTDGTLTPSKTVDMFTNKFHDFMNLEDCCEIANFKWNDNVCAKFFSSVCEYGWA